MDHKGQSIDEFRPMLFSIAYNMLGTISDAEDMVQETYISWMSADQSHVENTKFYLIRIISNKCIAHLKRLKKEREAYKGVWLPEPILANTALEDASNAHDNLSIGFMYLLEKLTPVERGVLILKEAFNVSHQEIAEIFNISYEGCRQYLSRAKRKVILEDTRFKVNINDHENVLREFLDACVSRNPERLISLLREDVMVYSDGGGIIKGVLKPIFGKEHVSRLFLSGMEQLDLFTRVEILSINGLAGAAFYQTSESTTPDLLIAIESDENQKVGSVFFMANPLKIMPAGFL